MIKIVVDDAMRRKLGGLSEPIELCDESGRILGRVFPSVDLSEYEPWEPEASEEELRRREQSSDWFTTREVIDHLENL